PALGVRIRQPKGRLLSTVRRQGALRTRVTLSRGAQVRVRATVSARWARRLGLRVPKGADRVTLGSGEATKRYAGRLVVRVPLRTTVRRALGRARSSVPVRLAVTVASDGDRSTAQRTVALRR
ncbi:hypothetical protein ACVU7I_08725, partial [Patulibacter sp. S7RM1-6]